MTLRGTVPANRVVAWILTVLVVAVAALFAAPGVRPAMAACGVTDPASCLSSSDSSSTSSVADCLDPPTPAMPDTGSSSFFASPPSQADIANQRSAASVYDLHSYAGLSFHTYDLGCGPSAAVAPDALVDTSVGNMLMSVATFITGLTNAVREHAYDPDSMWGWTDPVVTSATDALYKQIFSVFGFLAIVIVGSWLMWTARHGQLSDAAATAGWAILVMVITTAIAAWPMRAATAADTGLTKSIGAVSFALHSQRNEPCAATGCVDSRTAQRRASSVLTDVVLYRQWLTGELGSADSPTAIKYGDDLLDASTFSWSNVQTIKADPASRAKLVEIKQQKWKDTAAKIKESDPDAYEYLTGRQGTDRIGAGFTALISAAAASPFDLAASILILVGFLAIRLAVIFLPAIAAVGILRPASGGLRELFRTVVAALLNCFIFGIGSSVYLLALDFITSTKSLAGWQQILLIFLTGAVMWMLLRPFARLTSLAGGIPFGGRLRELRRQAFGGAAAAVGAVVGSKAAENAEDGVTEGNQSARPETWTRDGSNVRVAEAPPAAPSRSTRVPDSSPVSAGAGGSGRDPVPVRDPAPLRVSATRPETGSGVDYRDPSYPVATGGEVLPVESDQSFVVYRPDSGYRTVEPDVRPESRIPASRDLDETPVGN